MALRDDAATAQTKQAMRRSMRRRLRGLSPQALQRGSADVVRQARSRVGPGAVVLAYVALPDEVDLGPALTDWATGSQRLVLPVYEDGPLRLREVSDLAGLVDGAFGLREPGPEHPEMDPEAVDVALVPGRAFDDGGGRLGRGGGSYDRLLPRLRPGAVVLGVAFDVQRVPQVPREPHDVPLGGVLWGRTPA